MNQTSSKKIHHEANLFLEYLKDPQVTEATQILLEAMPAWKKQFLSGYYLPQQSTKVANRDEARKAA
jgi:hypothetical protein